MVNETPQVSITTVQGEPLAAFPYDYPFRIEVTLPEGTTPPPKTIQVDLNTGVDSDTLTLAWDGNVGAPRYRSNPVTLETGAEGGGTFQLGGDWSIFQFEFSRGGIGSLSYEDGGELTIEYDGTAATATIYESFHTMTIAQVETRFVAEETFWASVNDQLAESDDPRDQAVLDLGAVRLDAIGRGRSVMTNENLWMSQRAAGARFYFDVVSTAGPQYDERTESDGLNGVLNQARRESTDVITAAFGTILFGSYDMFTHITMSAQVVEIFGIDIYGNELGFYDRLYATFDLAGGLALEAVGVVGGLQQASRGAGRGGPRQLAETGEIVTDVRNLEVGTPVSPISYGMMDADARHIRHVADEFGVVVEFRPANVDSMGWQARGHPRKPVKIKQKTINEIDVHLGADANNIGLAGYFEPTLPANLDELSPGLQTEIRGRHSQRLKEFNDGKVELGAMQDAGKIRLEDGLIIDTGLCGDTGLAITGDLDPWRVTRNGRELNAVETQPIIDALADGPANVQHSTHVTWDVPSDLQHIDDKIRGSHQTTPQGGEGESLIAFGGHGSGPPRATYSGIDVIPGSTGVDLSPTTGLASGGAVQTGRAAVGVRTGVAAGTTDGDAGASATAGDDGATGIEDGGAGGPSSLPAIPGWIPGGWRTVVGVGGAFLLGGFLFLGFAFGNGNDGAAGDSGNVNPPSSGSGSSSSGGLAAASEPTTSPPTETLPEPPASESPPEPPASESPPEQPATETPPEPPATEAPPEPPANEPQPEPPATEPSPEPSPTTTTPSLPPGITPVAIIPLLNGFQAIYVGPVSATSGDVLIGPNASHVSGVLDAQGQITMTLNVNEASGTASVLWFSFLDALYQAVSFGVN